MFAPIMLGPIPLDFVLFALTLLGVALFHKRTLEVALTGLAVILAYKFLFAGFRTGPGMAGFAAHMAHEWVILVNLLLLLHRGPKCAAALLRLCQGDQPSIIRLRHQKGFAHDPTR